MYIREMVAPYKETDNLELKANQILSSFNFKYPDEIDIRSICFKNKVRIIPSDNEFSFSVPFRTKKGGLGTIFLSTSENELIRKQILAHEFAHLTLHCSNQLNKKMYEVNKDENQANRMAAYLLMPMKFLSKIYLSMDQPVDISEIADYFLVTDEFAQYRLSLLFNNQKVDMLAKDHKGRWGSIECF